MFNFTVYVCLCMGVTDREIKREIENGARTMDAIGCRTGAGTSCGSCQSDIADMLRSHAPCPAPGSCDASPDGCDSKRRLDLFDERRAPAA